jgi:hypothetical protein
MPWLDSIYNAWKGSVSEKGESPIFQRINFPGGPPQRQLVVDGDYVSVRLQAMRIVNVRKGISKFYGCVHSFVSLLDQRSGGIAEFHVVSTPDKLKDLDAQNVNRVVTQDIPLLTNVPYRGGLHLQLGLFSVKSTDLVAPYLSLLESLSSVAGVGFVQTALTLSNPIKSGIDLLFGAKAIELEVGVNESPATPDTGTYVLMRAPGNMDVAQLQINANKDIEDQAKHLISDYPYLIFSIDASNKRDDWFHIPDIKAAHDELMEALRRNKLKEAEQEIFPHFRRICLTSPDLLLRHAMSIADEEEKRMKTVLKPMRTARRELDTWSLKDVDPFVN